MRKLESQERLDGIPVDSYEGRIVGSFDLDFSDGSRLAWGDEVLVIVRGRAKQATFKETATGDTRRVQVIKPEQVRLVWDQVLERRLVEEYGFEPSPKLPFDDHMSSDLGVMSSDSGATGRTGSTGTTPDEEGEEDEEVEEVASEFDVPPVKRTDSSEPRRVATVAPHDQTLAKFLSETA